MRAIATRAGASGRSPWSDGSVRARVVPCENGPRGALARRGAGRARRRSAPDPAASPARDGLRPRAPPRSPVRSLDSTAIGWSGEVRAQGSLERPARWLDVRRGGAAPRRAAPTSGSGGATRGTGGSTGSAPPVRPTWCVRAPDDPLRSTSEDSVGWSPYSPVRLPDDNDIIPRDAGGPAARRSRADELSPAAGTRVAGRSAADCASCPRARARRSRASTSGPTSPRGCPSASRCTARGLGASPVHDERGRRLRARHVRRERRPASSSRPRSTSSGGRRLDAVASANAFAPFLLPVARGRPRTPWRCERAGRRRRLRPRAHRAPRRSPARHRGRRAARPARPQPRIARGRQRAWPSRWVRSRSCWCEGERGNFLLTGTVTPEALRQAGDGARSARR